MNRVVQAHGLGGAVEARPLQRELHRQQTELRPDVGVVKPQPLTWSAIGAELPRAKLVGWFAGGVLPEPPP